MARITVEDCLDYVDNRFELVLVGTKRARQIATGGIEPMVPEENDKPTVIALREIEKGLIDPAILNEKDEPEYNDTLAVNTDIHTGEPINAEEAINGNSELDVRQ